MGAVTGLLGIGGGSAGTNVPPAALAAIQAANPETNQAYLNSVNSLSSQSQLLGALAGQHGIANQGQVYGQLQGVANGTGPNPAQAMLNNATGTNVANTAATMAGARGASSNVGLMARQIGQTGAGIQQNAVGQGAALQAEQSLGALQAAGMIANNQVTNQMGATGALNQFAQNEQGLTQTALGNFNNAQISNQNSVNTSNAAIAAQSAKGQAGTLGGLIGGVASVVGLAGGGDPAEVAVEENPEALESETYTGMPDESALPRNYPKSSAGRFFKGLAKETVAQETDATGKLLKALGGETTVGSKLQGGGKVPGTPKVGGAVNSYANDTVNAKLSPGEIVLPRSVTQSSDPVAASMRFVQAVMEKKRRENT